MSRLDGLGGLLAKSQIHFVQGRLRGLSLLVQVIIGFFGFF